MLHCGSPAAIRALGSRLFKLLDRLSLGRLASGGRCGSDLVPAGWQDFDDINDPVALRQDLVIRSVGGLDVDAAAQSVTRANVELPAVEAVERGAGLCDGCGSRFSMLQLPLPASLVVRHFDDEDDIGGVIDQFAREKQRPGVFDTLVEIELG